MTPIKNSKVKPPVQLATPVVDDFSYLVSADAFLSLQDNTNRILYKTLTNAVISGRLCHAYLLYGDKGVGKKTLARLFAMSALCTGSVNTDSNEKKPCFSCNSCKKFLSKNHSDYFEFEEKLTKRSIHIDRIRDLKRSVYIKPNESTYRIYVIPSAQNMTTEGFNAFLKLLEEPPPHSIFILTTTDKSAVAPTVLSRCVPFPIHPATVAHCYYILAKTYPTIPQNTLQKASVLADGNLAKAIEISGDESYATALSLAYHILDCIITPDEYELLKAFTTQVKTRADFIKLLDILLQVTRQLLNQNLYQDMATPFDDDINDRTNSIDEQVLALSQKYITYSSSKLCDMLQLLLTAQEHLELNSNQNLIVNWLCSNLIK